MFLYINNVNIIYIKTSIDTEFKRETKYTINQVYTQMQKKYKTIYSDI